MQDTQPARGLWTEKLRGLGAGPGWCPCGGEREGWGLGQAAGHEPAWGLDLGPLRAARGGLGPGGPSPETLKRIRFPGKSQGFPMLTVDSLFPKTQEG